jgi:propanol-preferring alcohol dehydrogenase
VVVPAVALAPVPAGVSAAQAAVSTDAVATAYHAVKVVGDVRLAQTVGIIGLGGLGLNGLQTALMCGAQVYACDREAVKDDVAKQAGALAVYRDAHELAQHEPEVIVDFVGMESTMSAALKSVRVGGRVVLVGLGAAAVPLPVFNVTNRKLTIRGSWGATRESRIEVLALIARGKLVPEIEEIALDQALEGYQRLHEGRVLGRLAVVIPRR